MQSVQLFLVVVYVWKIYVLIPGFKNMESASTFREYVSLTSLTYIDEYASGKSQLRSKEKVRTFLTRQWISW
jgi:hypothetical protein